MSRIDQLIAELAPHGVPYKTVSDVAVYVRGVTYSKDDEQPDGPVRVLRSNNIALSSNTLNFDDVRTVAERVRVRPDQRLKAEDILISAASGSKAHVGKVAYVWEDIDYCFGGFMAVLRVSGHVDSRFLFHLLIGKAFSNYLEATLTSTTINNLNSSTMGGFSIPVPPLPVQEEIVRILDKFTELEAELETELEARTTQYEETRNSLLSLDGDLTGHPLAELIAERCPNGVEFKTLGDVASVGTGSSDRKDASDGGEFPFYVRSKNVLRIDSYEFDEDAILIPGEGGIGEIFHFVSGKYALHQRAYRISFKTPDIDTKFAYYVFSVHFRKFILQKAVSATVTSIRKPMITDFQIPVPPLEIQREIVRILDKFDALVNDLSVGLPAEIAARRKQYEYYRDRLLSFEELAG